MSTRFDFPVRWDALRGLLRELLGGVDPAAYADAMYRRDITLEDYLNGLPWTDTVTTGAANPTDALGRLTVAHGLPYTPEVVGGWSMGPDGGPLTFATVICSLPTATTFTARLLDNSGLAIATAASIATPCTFGWMAAP